MFRAISAIFLTLILTLLGTGISEAELWLCTQPDGSGLYTDQPGNMGSCEKYEPVSELVYMPPIIRENLPAPVTMTDNKQAAYEPVARPDSSEEWGPAPSEASVYNSQLSNQGGYSYVYPGDVEIYNYVSGVYGLPSGRHKHITGFPNERRRYDFRHGMPFQPDRGAPAPPAHSPKSSPQPVVPAVPPSFPGFTQEIQHR
jgi:hypothetical protein